MQQEKKIGLFSLTSLVVGNLIGSGIFLLPGDVAKFGMASLWAWLFTIMGTFLLVFVFTKNVAFVKRSGGPYVAVKQAFGNFFGFQTAYCHWFGVWAANAALALAVGSYLIVLLPKLGIIPEYMLGIAALWVATFINMCGVRAMSITQNITTIMKVMLVFGVVLLGLKYANFDHVVEMVKSSTVSINDIPISHVAALTLWAFIGVESATVAYDSVENPERNIVLATVFGTIIAAFLYVASSVIIASALPASLLLISGSPFFAAGELIFGAYGKPIIAIGAVISCFGAINGWTYIQSQIALAAAKDGFFPKLFGICNAYNVPARGLLFTVFLSSLLLLLNLNADSLSHFEIILVLASFAALIPYVYSSFTCVILMMKFRQFKMIFIPALAIPYSIWAISSSGGKFISYGIILLCTTILLYFLTLGRIKSN